MFSFSAVLGYIVGPGSISATDEMGDAQEGLQLILEFLSIFFCLPRDLYSEFSRVSGSRFPIPRQMWGSPLCHEKSKGKPGSYELRRFSFEMGLPRIRLD